MPVTQKQLTANRKYFHSHQSANSPRERQALLHKRNRENKPNSPQPITAEKLQGIYRQISVQKHHKKTLKTTSSRVDQNPQREPLLPTGSDNHPVMLRRRVISCATNTAVLINDPPVNSGVIIQIRRSRADPAASVDTDTV